MINLTAGSILVSDPFLKDPNFARTVVLICEHREEGSQGFVLNKPYSKNLNQLIDGVGNAHIPVFCGGPVELNVLHFIHKRPDLIKCGIQITEDLFWGGEYENVLQLIQQGEITPRDIRFYIGYSGWDEGQLNAEIDEKSWLVHKAKTQFVFHHNTDLVWKDVLTDMGGDYKQLIHYPKDPMLN